MTRKARKSRKNKSKVKSRRYKGGAFLATGLAKTFGSSALKMAASTSKASSLLKSAVDIAKQRMPGLKSTGIPINETPIEPKKGTDLEDVKQVLKFSLGAIIMSPLYIATVLANMPLNTLHNLTGKRINEKHSDAIGIQLYKYMFEGYKRPIEEEGLIEKIGENPHLFHVPDGTIKKNVIVKCDNCQKSPDQKSPDQKSTNIQKGGYMNTFKTFDEIMGFKPFNGIKGALGEMGFEKYKDQIAKSVAYQNEQITHKLRELEFEIDSIKDNFSKRKSELKKNIKYLKIELLFKSIVVCETLITDCTEKTDNIKVKVNKDLVIVSNPYRRINMDDSHFKMNVCFLYDNCKTECEKCTLFDNIISIYHSYARILLSTLRGKTNNLYVIIDLLFTILKNGLDSEKPTINLDDISSMKYSGDTTHIKEELKKPIELFKRLICDYGLYDGMKKEFTERVKLLDEEQKKILLIKLQSII